MFFSKGMKERKEGIAFLSLKREIDFLFADILLSSAFLLLERDAIRYTPIDPSCPINLFNIIVLSYYRLRRLCENIFTLDY